MGGDALEFLKSLRWTMTNVENVKNFECHITYWQAVKLNKILLDKENNKRYNGE